MANRFGDAPTISRFGDSSVLPERDIYANVPGMGKLGGTAPGVPRPTLPEPLDKNVNLYRPLPKFIGQGLEKLSQVLPSVASGDYARATNEAIEGAGQAGSPFLLPVAAAGPVATAVGIGTGLAAQKGGEKLAAKLGANPEQARAVGNVAGAATGALQASPRVRAATGEAVASGWNALKDIPTSWSELKQQGVVPVLAGIATDFGVHKAVPGLPVEGRLVAAGVGSRIPAAASAARKGFVSGWRGYIPERVGPSGLDAITGEVKTPASVPRYEKGRTFTTPQRTRPLTETEQGYEAQANAKPEPKPDRQPPGWKTAGAEPSTSTTPDATPIPPEKPGTLPSGRVVWEKTEQPSPPPQKAPEPSTPIRTQPKDAPYTIAPSGEHHIVDAEGNIVKTLPTKEAASKEAGVMIRGHHREFGTAPALAERLKSIGASREGIEALSPEDQAALWKGAGQWPGVSKQKKYSPSPETQEAVLKQLPQKRAEVNWDQPLHESLAPAKEAAQNLKQMFRSQLEPPEPEPPSEPYAAGGLLPEYRGLPGRGPSYLPFR